MKKKNYSLSGLYLHAKNVTKTQMIVRSEENIYLICREAYKINNLEVKKPSLPQLDIILNGQPLNENNTSSNKGPNWKYIRHSAIMSHPFNFLLFVCNRL